jgi:glycerol-3-phosphate dehydrogenase
MLFFTPWRGWSMVGTKYIAYEGDPDNIKVTDEDVQTVLDEINRAHPSAQLKKADILFVNSGLVPISSTNAATGTLRRMRHYRIRHHLDEGLSGLISVLGVKYTTARDIAERVINQVFEIRGQDPPPSTSAITPLHGGQIEHLDVFLKAEIEKKPLGLKDETIRHLIFNYGASYKEVLNYYHTFDDGVTLPPDENAVLNAEIRHGVREEMAVKLADVVFRRTNLGLVGYPGDETLRICAEIMGQELGWNQTRIRQELEEVQDVYFWRN